MLITQEQFNAAVIIKCDFSPAYETDEIYLLFFDNQYHIVQALGCSCPSFETMIGLAGYRPWDDGKAAELTPEWSGDKDLLHARLYHDPNMPSRPCNPGDSDYANMREFWSHVEKHLRDVSYKHV